MTTRPRWRSRRRRPRRLRRELLHHRGPRRRTGRRRPRRHRRHKRPPNRRKRSPQQIAFRTVPTCSRSTEARAQARRRQAFAARTAPRAARSCAIVFRLPPARGQDGDVYAPRPPRYLTSVRKPRRSPARPARRSASCAATVRLPTPSCAAVRPRAGRASTTGTGATRSEGSILNRNVPRNMSSAV